MTAHSSDSTRSSFARESLQPSNSTTCVICQSVYAPAQGHRYLSQASPAVIESTFMSICHFCFRCRRPSCPSCWDDVHGVCGACALEAKLPFRAALAPLQGALFAPPRRFQASRRRSTPTPLVCIKAGRFQSNALPIETQTTITIQSVNSSVLSQAIRQSSLLQKPDPSISSLATVSAPAVRSLQEANEPEETGDDLSEAATRPEPLSATRRISWLSRLERWLTVFLFLVLLTVLTIIALALLSSRINLWFLQHIHIDIRGEVAYLWLLVRNLHF